MTTPYKRNRDYCENDDSETNKRPCFRETPPYKRNRDYCENDDSETNKRPCFRETPRFGGRGRQQKRAPPKKRERSPPSPREYRKRRRRDDDLWTVMKPPESVTTIRELIAFAYTYHGPNVDVDKIKKIVPQLLELDAMVGLATTKRTILDMVMHYTQGRHKKNEDYLHMVVCGPPGCGKTTFCKILGKILAGLGVLPKDTFTTVKRTDLVAKYLGQTAHRTEDLLKKCQGGVMFIDEAYALAPRDTDRDSFAKEAIDFLNQFLSEHKDDLACIIAGYEAELYRTFFAMNEGLERRFPWKFVIESYDADDLFEIFKRMLKKAGYELEEGAITAEFFTKNKDLFNFAGGDIETFITKCKFIHTRNSYGKDINNVFTKKDLEDGIKEHRGHKIKKDDNKPPFMMYI